MWERKSLLYRCSLALSTQFDFNVSSHHTQQGTPKGSPAVSHLCCVLWHRKTEPTPFLLLSTSLQQIPTIRASFLYKRTEQQHIKSLQSPKGQNRRKHTHPLPNKKKNQTQTNPHTFLLCFVMSPFSVQCKHSVAEMFPFCVRRGCAIQHWGHLPAPEHVFNARRQNTISCARFTSPSPCYYRNHSNCHVSFCIYRLILVFTIKWFNKVRSRALSRKARAFVESYWWAFTNFSWTDKW